MLNFLVKAYKQFQEEKEHQNAIKESVLTVLRGSCDKSLTIQDIRDQLRHFGIYSSIFDIEEALNKLTREGNRIKKNTIVTYWYEKQWDYTIKRS